MRLGTPFSYASTKTLCVRTSYKVPPTKQLSPTFYSGRLSGLPPSFDSSFLLLKVLRQLSLLSHHTIDPICCCTFDLKNGIDDLTTSLPSYFQALTARPVGDWQLLPRHIGDLDYLHFH